jgi:hypothetical protein
MLSREVHQVRAPAAGSVVERRHSARRQFACQMAGIVDIVIHSYRTTHMQTTHFFTGYFYFSNSNPKAVE